MRTHILGAALAVGLLLAAPGRVLNAQAPQPSAGEDLRAVLSAIPDQKRGARLFQLCAQCHGANGQGIGEAWTPAIAGQLPRVLAKQLVDYRHGARWDPRMEKIAGRHILKSTQDIADVVAYVGLLNAPPPSSIGSGEWLARGEPLYTARCSTCHGGQGEGSGARFVPRLAGQRYDYLLRQLHDAIEGRRPGLSAIHERGLEKLDMEQLMGLADYISRMSAGGAQRVALSPDRAAPATARAFLHQILGD